MGKVCYLIVCSNKTHPNVNLFLSSYELHMHTYCPPYLKSVAKTCSPGPTEVKYKGKGQSANVSDLQPYTAYNLRVVSYNSVGSSASEWISFTTKKECEYMGTVRNYPSSMWNCIGSEKSLSLFPSILKNSLYHSH